MGDQLECSKGALNQRCALYNFISDDSEQLWVIESLGSEVRGFGRRVNIQAVLKVSTHA